MGLLTNHYISLMQGELNRYQDTCKLLKDYYVGMEGGLGPKKGIKCPFSLTCFYFSLFSAGHRLTFFLYFHSAIAFVHIQNSY